MARRGGKYGGKRRIPRARPHGPKERQKIPMLDMRHYEVFRFELRRVMAESALDESHQSTFVANVLAKAQHKSIDVAKEYVHSVEASGDIGKETADAVCRLLDRYMRWR